MIEHTEHFFNQGIATGRKIPEFENSSLSFLKEIIYRGYRVVYDDSYEKGKIYIVLVINGRQSLQFQV